MVSTRLKALHGKGLGHEFESRHFHQYRRYGSIVGSIPPALAKKRRKGEFKVIVNVCLLLVIVVWGVYLNSLK